MSEVEYMMATFNLSEENARKAIDNGFRVSELMNGTAMEWFKKESGIGKGLSDVASEINKLKKSVEEGEKSL